MVQPQKTKFKSRSLVIRSRDASEFPRDDERPVQSRHMTRGAWPSE